MFNSPQKTLVVVGAGPKGLAVAIKSKVLQEFGISADKIILVDKNGVGANWSGEFGYTNGEMKLGTSPEKDLVFPIETDVGDIELNQRIQKRLLHFTWTSFLVQTGLYSDWIDRGRPAPCHQSWANYLVWVSEQLSPETQFLAAEVLRIGINRDLKNPLWELKLKSEQKTEFLLADHLMITGPGKSRMNFLPSTQSHLPQGVYDLESFWSSIKAKSFLTKGSLAIVGAGENSASVLLALAKYAPDLKVDIISPKGFISTRAENFYENRVYSQPTKSGWADLELTDRIDFIERTDLGVFSSHAMSILNEQVRHQIISGRLLKIEVMGDQLNLDVEYQKQTSKLNYDQVVLATGFDQIETLRSFFSFEVMQFFEDKIGESLTYQKVAERITDDLSFDIKCPKLYLPMFAGLAQGPGFANLSCLGLLSDRILSSSMQRQQQKKPILKKVLS